MGDYYRKFRLIVCDNRGNKKNRRLQRQNLYREGDEVQSAVIKKILRKKVILNVNGQDQILKIAEYRRAQRTMRKAIRPIRQKRSLNRMHIENAASNVKNLLSQANVKRHSDGLLPTRIRPNSIFRRMGLRNGDVITHFNGRSIDPIEDALNIWEDLRGSSNVNLGIKRRGRTRTIEYTIKLVGWRINVSLWIYRTESFSIQKAQGKFNFIIVAEY